MKTWQLSVAIFFTCLSAPLFAQQHNVPGSAPSGYDPFQLNWATGRFDYAPIPYDTSTGPYEFNWYTGHWDYRPVAPPQSPAEIASQGKSPGPALVPPPVQTARPAPQAPANPALVDQAMPAGAYISPEVAPEKTTTVQKLQRRKPTTRTLATKPSNASAFPPKNDPLHLSPSIGRWEFDYAQGKWIHILPPG